MKGNASCHSDHFLSVPPTPLLPTLHSMELELKQNQLQETCGNETALVAIVTGSLSVSLCSARPSLGPPSVLCGGVGYMSPGRVSSAFASCCTHSCVHTHTRQDVGCTHRLGCSCESSTCCARIGKVQSCEMKETPTRLLTQPKSPPTEAWSLRSARPRAEISLSLQSSYLDV